MNVDTSQPDIFFFPFCEVEMSAKSHRDGIYRLTNGRVSALAQTAQECRRSSINSGDVKWAKPPGERLPHIKYMVMKCV